MIEFTIYETATGRIVRSGYSPNPMEDQDIGAGEGIIEGSADPALFYVAGGTFVAYPPRPGRWALWTGSQWTDPRSAQDLQAALGGARSAAIAAINAVAGKIRRLYVTDIPGQEALYLMKEAEARAWVASALTLSTPKLTVGISPTPAQPNPADFPLITAEVGITAPTAGQVAQVYLNMAAIWTDAAANLEHARLGHIAQAEVAPTAEAAQAIADAFAALINA